MFCRGGSGDDPLDAGTVNYTCNGGRSTSCGEGCGDAVQAHWRGKTTATSLHSTDAMSAARWRQVSQVRARRVSIRSYTAMLWPFHERGTRSSPSHTDGYTSTQTPPAKREADGEGLVLIVESCPCEHDRAAASTQVVSAGVGRR